MSSLKFQGIRSSYDWCCGHHKAPNDLGNTWSNTRDL